MEPEAGPKPIDVTNYILEPERETRRNRRNALIWVLGGVASAGVVLSSIFYQPLDPDKLPKAVQVQPTADASPSIAPSTETPSSEPTTWVVISESGSPSPRPTPSSEASTPSVETPSPRPTEQASTSSPEPIPIPSDVPTPTSTIAPTPTVAPSSLETSVAPPATESVSPQPSTIESSDSQPNELSIDAIDNPAALQQALEAGLLEIITTNNGRQSADVIANGTRDGSSLYSSLPNSDKNTITTKNQILWKKTFALKGSEAIPLRQKNNKFRDSPNRRQSKNGFTVANLEFLQNGENFYVVNAQLPSRNSHSPFDIPNDIRYSEKLRHYLKKLKHQQQPIIVAGQINELVMAGLDFKKENESLYKWDPTGDSHVTHP